MLPTTFAPPSLIIACITVMALPASIWSHAAESSARPVADREQPICTPEQPNLPPPNVLLIVLDDLGTQRLSSYQQSATFAKTPRLDRIAANGVQFSNAYACPLCSPSRAAIQTGRHP